MFEKEAEEYCDNLIQNEIKIKSIYDIEVLQKDLEKLFQYAAKFGFNKANEWHYVKGGDLPKTKKRVLVLLKDVEEPILDYYRQDGLWNYALENEVLAWKEIVLPEPPKYWNLSTGENNINKENE